MSVVTALLLLASAPTQATRASGEGDSFPGRGPFDQLMVGQARVGPGRYTLVILTPGSPATQIDYPTGPQCQRAVVAIRQQVDAPVLLIFCVPR